MFGFLSSYPPTQCGLATFTAALRSEIGRAGHETGVVRVDTKAANFYVTDVPLHTVLTVSGQVVPGTEAQVSATGMSY